MRASQNPAVTHPDIPNTSVRGPAGNGRSAAGPNLKFMGPVLGAGLSGHKAGAKNDDQKKSFLHALAVSESAILTILAEPSTLRRSPRRDSSIEEGSRL